MDCEPIRYQHDKLIRTWRGVRLALATHASNTGRAAHRRARSTAPARADVLSARTKSPDITRLAERRAARRAPRLRVDGERAPARVCSNRAGADFSTSFDRRAASDAALSNLSSHDQRRHFAPLRVLARVVIQKRNFRSKKRSDLSATGNFSFSISFPRKSSA